MKKTIIILSFITANISLYGQSCPSQPAPCPHDDEISVAQNVTEREKNNDVLPQEIAMETKVRESLTAILQTIVNKKHWQLYQLNESGYNRPNSFIAYPTWRNTPYEKRPPHAYDISFIVITNRDSLRAWRNWTNIYTQQSQQAADAVNADMQNMSKNKQLQAYMDSAQHYSQLRMKYITDHQPQLLSAIKANNQRGIEAYNAKSDAYLAKFNRFMKKYQDLSEESRESSTSIVNKLQEDKTTKTQHFANASVLLVYIAVNQSQAGYGATNGSQKCILPQKKLAVANAFYAGMLKNPNDRTEDAYEVGAYDFAYKNPAYAATVFYGSWLHKPNTYNYMLAAYQPFDLTGIKKIKCDVVQNLAVQIEGGPEYINQALREIDMAGLEKMIGQ